MCGRYTQHHSTGEVVERFAVRQMLFPFEPRYNIAPTQTAAVVLVEKSKRILRGLRWGLVPSWADDPSIGNRMINARSETVAQKPSFRHAFRKRRCLVPADGFFEWRKEADGTKTPIYITVQDGVLFALAGLWERWTDGQAQQIDSFTILTTEPNELLKPIHNRMPVIIKPSDESSWLDPAIEDAEALSKLISPYPADAMSVRTVSRTVNKPANDNPSCIEPIESGLF